MAQLVSAHKRQGGCYWTRCGNSHMCEDFMNTEVFGATYTAYLGRIF